MRILIRLLLIFYALIWPCWADQATWSPSDYADGYVLYFKDKVSGSVEFIKVTGGLADNKELNIRSGDYEVTITAYNDFGESDPSNMVEYYVPPFSSLRFVTTPSAIKLSPGPHFTLSQTIGARVDHTGVFISGAAKTGYVPPELSPISVYRFDSSALTTDALGLNTPVNHGVSEASGRADFSKAEGDYFDFGDASLSANFPFKSGTSNTSGTFFLDVEFKDLPTTWDGMQVITKYNDDTDIGSFVFGVRNSNDTWKFIQRSASGFTEINCLIVPIPGRVYKVAVSYNGSTNTVLIMIFDTITQSLIDFDSVTSGTQNWQYTFSEPMVLNSTPLRLGAYANSDGFFNGYLDNFCIYNSALSADEILAKFLTD